MQITIEDLSPVEKRVEFELPWADVAPQARQGVRRTPPWRAPARLPAGQGAARAAREDVPPPGRGRGRARPGRTLAGAGDPREPDPAGRAADGRRAGDQVGRAVQVHGARRGALAGHAQGLHGPACVAAPGQGDRRSRRRGAGGLSQAADRVQADRRAAGDRRHRPGARRAVREGRRPQAEAPPGGDRSRERRRGAAARAAQPAAWQGHRRRRRGRLRVADGGRAGRDGGRPGAPARDHQGSAREEGAGARRRDGQGHRRGRDARGPARQGTREVAGGRPAAHQGRDDARAGQGAGQAQRVPRRAGADRPLRAVDRQPRQAAAA